MRSRRTERAGWHRRPGRRPLAALVVLAVACAAAGLRAQERAPLPTDTLPADLLARPVPLGLPGALSPPAVTPRDRALHGLGRRLFFDPLLSRDRSVSCASCHDPAHGFATPEALPRGFADRRARRNAPTVVNRAFGSLHSFDGRAASLEAQMLLPIANDDEMGLPVAEAVRRVAAADAYGPEFRRLLGRSPGEDDLAASLAAFVRHLYEGGSRVDEFRAGASAALSPEERGGLWIFESKGRCWRCHAGPNFSDESFHNTGVGVVDGRAEPGRAALTGREEDRGRFKTASLRGLARTAPYMHDGSLATLEDVVAFYRRGGGRNPGVDPELVPLELDDVDAARLVAFLKALSR